MKIWINTDFEGHWPVGTAAMVIAETQEKAAEYLNKELREAGLPETSVFFMKQIPHVEGHVELMNDGDY